MKKLTMRRECFLIQPLVFALVCGCAPVREPNSDRAAKPGTQQTAEPAEAFSFEDAAVTLPSPGSVQLEPKGRFDARFKGNINYLRYQYDYYGEEMLEAFATRHYSPGKLLERVWDGEYAGKWLDAATRTAVNTGDDAQLAMVDAFAASLRRHQQPDGYMGIELPTDRDLDEWEEDWDLWCQWNSLNGLLTHYELRGQRASLEAATRVGAWIVKTYGPIEDKNASFFQGRVTGGFTRVVVIGQLVRLYRHTGNEDLLEFVGQVIRHYPPIQQMLSSGEPYLFHPYMLNAVLTGVVEYAKETRDYEMLSKVEQVWDGLVNDHLFPTGSLGNREDLKEGPLK
ncbi:MAG: beta-L-arabinofuranosidase domain-containing protein, partial [Planctomycetota bacterium]